MAKAKAQKFSVTVGCDFEGDYNLYIRTNEGEGPYANEESMEKISDLLQDALRYDAKKGFYLEAAK